MRSGNLYKFAQKIINMGDTTDIRNGLTINFKHGLYAITQFQHVKPGKGPAFVRTKLKNIETGKVIDNTFSSGAKLDIVRIERRPHQYLYRDETGLIFMHNETFEQIPIDEKLITGLGFLKEGMNVDIVVHADNEQPLFAELPPQVTLEITYTEPGIRGDTTSTSAMKPAKLETGTEINVPLFINIGDKIKIDTAEGTYIERVK
jgi:elongation factor P